MYSGVVFPAYGPYASASVCGVILPSPHNATLWCSCHRRICRISHGASTIDAMGDRYMLLITSSQMIYYTTPPHNYCIDNLTTNLRSIYDQSTKSARLDSPRNSIQVKRKPIEGNMFRTYITVYTAVNQS